jgi:purine-binding chemotaxis protein CheW
VSRVLVFRLDGRRHALDASSVVEVLPALAVSPLPGQPAYVAGVIDLRGAIVPVIDLRTRFARSPRPMELSDRVVVAGARRRLVALWVDDVEEIGELNEAAWAPAGGLVTGDRTLAGVVATAGGLTAIHDLDAFVAECEAEALYESAAR